MSNQLDILLVNVGSTKKHVYQDLSKDFSAIEPPFWAALTAGFLRNKGFNVDILDASFYNLDHTETAEIIEQRNPRFVDVVVYSQQANTCSPIMMAVGQLCKEIKRKNPTRQLILSGWHPTALPERTMAEEACDLLAQGEGFYTLQGILAGDKFTKIPGLWWREDGKILHNDRPPNVEDLTADLSEVAWDLLPMGSGQYRAFNWMCLQDLPSRNRCATMFTSLGCPYQCDFCAIHATFADRKIRYWSPAWVLRQLDILVNQYGVKNINLLDEIFIFKPEHYLPIAEGIIERGYEVNFCAFARVDIIDKTPPEHLDILKKAGFNWVKLGIESSSAEILRGIHKGHYGKEISRRVVHKLHNAGIDLCANFMFGLPGDTWETMQDVLNFAFELNCAFPSFFCTMAPPGSELYEQILKKGIPLPDSWLGWAQQGYEFLPLPTATLSAADVLRFRDYAFDAYFKNPRYLQTIGQKFGPEAREHIENMTRIKLRRKILGD
jgi:anaerobic magnesium-protoporphyrin IX monomethyl ester cyclase